MIKNIYRDLKVFNYEEYKGKGYAFYTMDSNNSALSELILVKENVKGYYKIDNGYIVAKHDADNIAKSENAKLGLSEEQAMDIVLTTMGG